MKNKKGFVLLETLVVTIFTLIIFTLLYTSTVPLLGKYKDLSYYNDIDITYDLFYLKRMITKDSNYNLITSSDYKNIKCTDLHDSNTCNNYFDALNIKNKDELIYMDLKKLDTYKSNLESDILDYINRIDKKYDNSKILILKRNDYISHLELGSKSLKEKLIENINNKAGSCQTKVEEDGIIYLSGTADCINFNYVWYSGKLWRITAINKDGTMKMITDDPITTISYGEDVNFYDISKKNDASYTGSYIYQWLNEDFLDTLYNYKNIIVEDSTWNIATSSDISTKLPETTLINNESIGKNTPVGLLNSYEYYLSYKNIGSTGYDEGYLNVGYYWWLINPYDSSYGWNISNYGNSYDCNPFYRNAARPSINLKSNIQLIGGSGTKDNPYKIAGDKEEATPNTTMLNTRSIGEYVIFDEDGSSQTSELYRIVSIEDGKVKLNKNDYIKNGTTVVEKKFSTSATYGNGTTDDYWDYYLNNTWYTNLVNKNMLESSTYYIKQVSPGTSYKNSLCNTNNTIETIKFCTKTTTVWEGLVGLPRYGEMFASLQGNGYNSSSNIWLITPYSSSDGWYIHSYGNVNYRNSSSLSNAARPSITLKSNIIITGGDGTKTNPFTIALKS